MKAKRSEKRNFIHPSCSAKYSESIMHSLSGRTLNLSCISPNKLYQCLLVQVTANFPFRSSFLFLVLSHSWYCSLQKTQTHKNCCRLIQDSVSPAHMYLGSQVFGEILIFRTVSPILSSLFSPSHLCHSLSSLGVFTAFLLSCYKLLPVLPSLSLLQY